MFRRRLTASTTTARKRSYVLLGPVWSPLIPEGQVLLFQRHVCLEPAFERQSLQHRVDCLFFGAARLAAWEAGLAARQGLPREERQRLAAPEAPPEEEGLARPEEGFARPRAGRHEQLLGWRCGRCGVSVGLASFFSTFSQRRPPTDKAAPRGL